MPKRVIDFDAMWGSDKLAACAPWAQAEYAWLYGLADACGCFELTNLRVIWGRVAAIRGNFTIERLEQVFAEFHDRGLLFVWEHEGKRYGHWTGSDVPGRLPAPSWRMRLERFAPPVPKQQLAEYMARFARGRAAMARAGFRGETGREGGDARGDLKFEISDLKKERGPIAGAQAWQRNNERIDSEIRGTEDSDLPEPRERCASERGSQMVEQRPLFAEPREDFGFENAGLRRNGELADRIGNLQAGERGPAASAAAAGAAAMQNDVALQSHHLAGDRGLKERVEEGQGQDLDWNGNLKWKVDGNWVAEQDAVRESSRAALVDRGDANRDCRSNPTPISNSRSNADSQFSAEPQAGPGGTPPPSVARRVADGAFAAKDMRCAEVRAGREQAPSAAPYAWRDRARERELAVERELWVGRGPVCGPGKVRPEVLERDRKREAERAALRAKPQRHRGF